MKRHLMLALVVVSVIAVAVFLVACSGGGSANPYGGSGSGAGAPAAGSAGSSSGTSGSAGATGNGTAVTIANFAFTPQSVTIKAGGTVTWTNQDSTQHDPTGQGGIAAPALSQGQSYSVTFSTPGTYKYICKIHPSMTGEVVVK